MVSRKTFIDTSAFYGAFRAEDPLHQTVDGFLRDPRRAFFTTDWIIGETVNLLTVRRKPHLGRKFLRQLEAPSNLTILYPTQETFHEAKALLLQYEDQRLPFTDCVSFVVMRSLKIPDALTSDRRFQAMGFAALLAAE